MNAGSDIAQSVSARFDDLSPQMQRAARFLLNNPEDAAVHSLRQMASQANISPPTFSRLARALGYENYEDLRNVFRGQFKRERARFADRARLLQSGDDPEASQSRGGFFIRHATAATANIQALAASIDTGELATCSDRLAAADRVLLLGTLSAGTLLDYLGYMARLAFDNWSVVGRTDGSASALARLTPKDAVILVSHVPFARRSIEAAILAAERGAYVVSITDGERPGPVRNASASFFIPTDSPQFFPSHVATLVLLEALMGMAIRRAGSDAERRISDVEEFHDRLGEYWPS